MIEVSLFKKVKKGILIGLFVALIGLALFLIASIPVTRADEVIDAFFTIAPGTKYGPYDTGTHYHTRVLIFKSVLRGDILTEGEEGVYLTVNGYNTQELRNIYVKGEKSFVIEPADDQYTFTFDNTEGSAPSLVKFMLREDWTASYSPLVWILGLVGLFLLIPSGLATFVITYTRSPKQKYHSTNNP